MFRLAVLPCFDLGRSNSSHVNTQLGGGHHWWFNFAGSLLDVELSLPVYQVRLDWLPLPCITLIRPSQLSCLGSSVGRASA